MITCKLVIRKKLVNNKNLIEKSSSLYWYNRLPLFLTQSVLQVESYAFISSGELPNLSAQQVTSCTPNVLQCGGSGGCFGSVTQLGFNYLQLFGQMAEDDYPYVSGTSAQTEECSYDSSKTIVSLTGYDTLPANNHEAVMTHLAEVTNNKLGKKN